MFLITATDKSDSNTYSKNGVLNQCIGSNNYRQGLTIGNAINIEINNSSFINSNGTSPEAGVDIEPDIGYSDSITFNSCIFENNNGAGLLMTNNTRNSSVINSIFKNNSYAQCQIVRCENALIDNNVFNNSY